MAKIGHFRLFWPFREHVDLFSKIGLQSSILVAQTSTTPHLKAEIEAHIFSQKKKNGPTTHTFGATGPNFSENPIWGEFRGI